MPFGLVLSDLELEFSNWTQICVANKVKNVTLKRVNIDV